MIFTAHNIFLLCKFFAESCLLAWMILLVFPKKQKNRLRLFPLCLLSAVVQLAAHIGLSSLSLAQDTFILRYALFMGLFGITAARFFTRAEHDAAFAAVFHFLVGAAIAQFLGTQTVFCIFGYQVLSAFDLTMQLISALVTAAAMLLCVGFCFCYRRKLPLLVGRQLLLSDLCSLAFLLLAILFNQFFCATTEYRIAAILLLVGLFLLHYLVLALLLRIAEERQEKLDSLHLGQQQELQLQYMRELNSLYDGMRALRHEYRNHATYLKYLLDSGNTTNLRNTCSALTSRKTGISGSLTPVTNWSTPFSARRSALPRRRTSPSASAQSSPKRLQSTAAVSAACCPTCWTTPLKQVSAKRNRKSPYSCSCKRIISSF